MCASGKIYDPAQNVGNSLLQIQSDSRKENELTDQLEEGQQTADALADIGDAVERTIPTGGLSEPVAQALSAAVEQATMEALEGIKSFLKTVWDAIVKAFSNALKWIKDAFNNIFSSDKVVEAKVQKVKVQVQKTQKAAGASADAAVAAVNEALAKSKAGSDKIDEVIEDIAKTVTKMTEDAKAKDAAKEHDEEIPQQLKDANEQLEQIKKGLFDPTMMFIELGSQSFKQYFRDTETSCFDSKEILRRFKLAIEGLSEFLGKEQAASLPYLKRTLDKEASELSKWQPEEKLPATTNIDDLTSRMFGIVALGGEKFLGNISGVDKNVYDVTKIIMAFDEDLFVKVLKDNVPGDEKTAKLQAAFFMPRPKLTNETAFMEVAGPDLQNGIVDVAEEKLKYSPLPDLISEVSKSLENFLKEGEKVKETIEKIVDEDKKRIAIKRLSFMMQDAQRGTLATLSVARKARAYELKMVNMLMDYTSSSAAVMAAVCRKKA